MSKLVIKEDLCGCSYHKSKCHLDASLKTFPAYRYQGEKNPVYSKDKTKNFF